MIKVFKNILFYYFKNVFVYILYTWNNVRTPPLLKVTVKVTLKDYLSAGVSYKCLKFTFLRNS